MNQQYILSTPSGPLPVEIIRSNRRTLGLEVTRDGLVKARLPMRLPVREAILFIEEHRDWILRKRAEVQRRREENDRRRLQQGVQPWQTGSGCRGRKLGDRKKRRNAGDGAITGRPDRRAEGTDQAEISGEDEKICSTDGRDLRSDHDPRSAHPLGELQQQGKSEFQLSAVLSAGGTDGLCRDP